VPLNDQELALLQDPVLSTEQKVAKLARYTLHALEATSEAKKRFSRDILQKAKHLSPNR
jgi:hypothetical protein